MERSICVPLHVSSFCPTQSKDAVLGEDIKTERIDAFLVYYDKVSFFLLAVHSLVADEVLELNNLLDLGVNEVSF